MAPEELDKVVSLEHHVVELDKAQRLLALEPQLDRVVGQHAVDAEMAAVVAQEIDVVQTIEPVGVVDYERVIGAVTEAQELFEDLLDAGDIRGDLAVAQELARFVLAGWVADLGRAAADEHDRPVPGLLQLAQHHDAEEVADMERWGGAVEADIAGRALGSRETVEPGLVSRLVDIAPRRELLQKVRFELAHQGWPERLDRKA